ncbi:hypothetical protein [Nocardia flavorosea]|nr:hypothetical protein [Nocardia flavorosea]
MPDVGGVRVDLSPADTRWVHNSNFGHMLAAIPHPSAPSFGMALDAAAAVSSAQPNGRVVFTVFGPLHELNGSMLAVQ